MAKRHLRHNFILGVLNGTVFQLGAAFVHPTTVLPVFLKQFTTSNVGDMVGKTIPMAYRGSFYAARFFFGSGLGILAGLMVRYVLHNSTAYPFPTNYVLLFSLAISFMTTSIVLYAFVREPPSEINGPRRTFIGILREVPVILRTDTNYRATWLSRILLAGQGLAGPFYVVLAQERFGLPEHIAGLFLSVQTFGGMVSNLGWGYLSRRCGNRMVVQVSAVGHVLAPLCALGMALLLPATGRTWAIGGAMLIFLLIGSAMSGNVIGYQSFLLDIAPEDRRPTYLGIMNTSMGLASLLPMLGGVLADVLGLKAVFLASAAMTCAGALTTRRLKSPGS